MNGTVVDDRKRIHSERRHFTQTLVLHYQEIKLMVETGVYPDPLIDHHTYLSISIHALVPPYTPVITKERHPGLISFVNCEIIYCTLLN